VIADAEARRQLAVALLRHTEATLQLPYMPPDTVAQPVFAGRAPVLGPHRLDSLDVIEALVAVEAELGVLIVDREELIAAATLEGLAGLLLARADRQAIERFCEKWATVGQYSP
jgi:acyl carrier protein